MAMAAAKNTSAGHGSPSTRGSGARHVMAAQNSSEQSSSAKMSRFSSFECAARAASDHDFFTFTVSCPALALPKNSDSCAGSTVSFSPERASCCASVLTFFSMCSRLRAVFLTYSATISMTFASGDTLVSIP